MLAKVEGDGPIAKSIKNMVPMYMAMLELCDTLEIIFDTSFNEQAHLSHQTFMNFSDFPRIHLCPPSRRR